MSSDGSRIPGFYRLSIPERRELLRARTGLGSSELQPLDTGGLDLDTADHMIENVVGTYALPLGVALNFRVNDRDLVVPMVVEEPSVVAAASNAARMVRAGGGFRADADPSVMIAQIQLLDVADPDEAAARILEHRVAILAEARAAVPRLVERGAGPCDLSTRVLSRPGEPDGGVLVVHVDVDCCDAMGANMVNTVAEAIGDRLAALAGPPARTGLRILSNLSDRRLVRVTARVPAAALADDEAEGPAVRDAIVSASRFAELDPYRAATHNKGIMNGVDAVLLATGNDWRGVEAGAHAFAARAGRYAPLSTWRRAPPAGNGGAPAGSGGAPAGSGGNEDDLLGSLEMPLAAGTVGGALRVHGGARLALALLAVTTARELACVAAAAGLATNLAALRALATEGIQRGHMTLHARVERLLRAADAVVNVKEVSK